MADLPLKIFSGSSHPVLAQEIASVLQLPLSKIELKRFASGELYAKPLETVRGCDVYVVQTATDKVNEDLMELFVMLDAFKRSFAAKVHVVMPNYAYARQDRVAAPREPISAKLVADLMSAAGADHLITITLHSDQAQGFFNFPVDNLNSRRFFVDYFHQKKLQDVVVVSPDAGGAKEAKKFADALGAGLAIINKTRPAHNQAAVTHLVGDVQGKTCILYDDMIDTGGSVVAAIQALRTFGAKGQVYLAATHAVFSQPVMDCLPQAGFTEVIVTNSIPLPPEKQFPGLKVLSIASLLAQTISNVHEAKSLSPLFN